MIAAAFQNNTLTQEREELQGEMQKSLLCTKTISPISIFAQTFNWLIVGLYITQKSLEVKS